MMFIVYAALSVNKPFIKANTQFVMKIPILIDRRGFLFVGMKMAVFIDRSEYGSIYLYIGLNDVAERSRCM